MFLSNTKRCLLLSFINTTLLWQLTIHVGKAEPSKIEILTLPLVVVHLDLKGMPPQLSYLKSILPSLRNLGANGLLLEYEDMFPYEGKIKNLSSEYAYTKQELSEFLSLAHYLGFEVIPLVQTFGHMEFALKLPEFRHLREHPLYPESICPSKPESQDLIKDMLRQIIEFHTDLFPLNIMHIGCDEVYNINVCENCKMRNQSELQLFVGHVNNVYGILKSISPNITVLIWDDMIRKVWSSGAQIISTLADVEPVYWDYTSVVHNPRDALLRYKHQFRNTWIATAFKGADGRTKSLPNLTTRYSNNYNWLKLMFDYEHIYKFKGIILTGWSRYGHMDPPCELLPASMPSLALNLLLVKRFKDGININSTGFEWISKEDFYQKYLNANLTKELSCNSYYPSYKGYTFIYQCKSDLIRLLYDYHEFQMSTLQYYFNEGIDTVDYYYYSHNIISPNSLTYKTWCLDTLQSLDKFTDKVSKQLKKYYDVHFIQEYLDIKSYFLRKILNRLDSLLSNYESVRVWSREEYRNILYEPKR